MTSDELVERIARRVVELLGNAPKAQQPRRRPLTTADVAKALGRSHDWVRDHRHELGLLPSVGVRPRLLFDANAVLRYTTVPAVVDTNRAHVSRTHASMLLPEHAQPSG